MSEEDVIAHWRKGSKESFRLAKHAHSDGSYMLALFHCHLAVEKALKALFMEQKRTTPPPTHDLLQVGLQLDISWTPEQKILLGHLTQYAVAARYSDPPWATKEATKENSEQWIKNCEYILSLVMP